MEWPALGRRSAQSPTISTFLLKRFITFVATLLAASVLIFAALGILPGNAAEVRLGATATPEAIAALSEQLGLNRPPVERYRRWLVGMLHGDLGMSVSYDTPVSDLIAERLVVTAPLAVMAMAMTTVLALVLGLYAASHHNKAGDVSVMTASQIGIAVPNFWFAILLVLVFAVKLQWFSAGGFPGWDDDPWQALKALLLPAVSLAVVQAAILARITRSAVLDVLREDFVRTARAKGLSQRAVLWRHVLRNAMVPVLTVMGLQFANLVTGTIVVEQVFSLPGLGRLIFQAISNRDVLLVQGIVMLLAATVIVINFIVDVLYAVIDPRLKGRS